MISNHQIISQVCAMSYTCIANNACYCIRTCVRTCTCIRNVGMILRTSWYHDDSVFRRLRGTSKQYVLYYLLSTSYFSTIMHALWRIRMSIDESIIPTEVHYYTMVCSRHFWWIRGDSRHTSWQWSLSTDSKYCGRGRTRRGRRERSRTTLTSSRATKSRYKCTQKLHWFRRS